MLEGTVKTPLGTASKKTVAVVAGGGVLIGGIVWYRSKQNAANAASTDTSSTDTTGTDTTGTDPGILGYDAQGNPIYPYYGGGGGGYYPGGGTGGTTQFTDNASWSQYAEDYLVNTVGMSSTTVGNALGKYITGQPVTDDQVSIINQAIAFANYPPVPGPHGNPPGFNHIAGGGGTVTNPVKGLRVMDRGYTSVSIEWDGESAAKSYLVTTMLGSKVIHKITVHKAAARIGNLHRNTEYHVRVRAQPGGTGGQDASINVKTR